LRLAVNVTVADLLDVKFPAEVQMVLVRRGLPASALVLELSESSVAEDPVRIGTALARLGELGVGLSLDEFGRGSASLLALRTIPVGEVKLDRSVVARMTGDRVEAAIARSAVTIGRELGMRVIAVGVEDQATANAVIAAGCELLQGYLVGKPVAAAELELALSVIEVGEGQAA
jgi:EAL domain-containing protein (putative c-di-GMP-specific phosphodiesterase class I)